MVLLKPDCYRRSLLIFAGFIFVFANVYSLQTELQPGLNVDVDKEAPAPEAAYDVATIKPADASRDSRRWVGFLPTGLSVKNMPLQMLIREAFALEDDRILGAPAWVKNSRFDIEAKVAESDIPTVKNMDDYDFLPGAIDFDDGPLCRRCQSERG
jgi:hypothetical protein